MEVGRDLHGGPWRSPWRSVEVSMELHGDLHGGLHGASMELHEPPWSSVSLHGAPWRPPRRVHAPSAVGQFASSNVLTASQSLVWATVRLSSELASSQHKGATTPLVLSSSYALCHPLL